jgi:hypothetical protein
MPASDKIRGESKHVIISVLCCNESVQEIFMKSLFKPLVFSLSAFMSNHVLAAPKEPPEALIRSAFQELLQATDANRDGKLVVTECMAIYKDRAVSEKNCKYWDANGDGTITEDEYVKQARNKMK